MMCLNRKKNKKIFNFKLISNFFIIYIILTISVAGVATVLNVQGMEKHLKTRNKRMSILLQIFNTICK